MAQIVQIQPLDVKPIGKSLWEMKNNKGPWIRSWILIYKVFRLFYASVYFYFMPFLVIWVPFVKYSFT